MARYVRDLVTSLGRAEAKSVISSYLSGVGFAYGSERGEAVWRKGSGTLSAPQFVKAEPTDGRVHIEAWVPAFAFLPGTYAGEQALGGFYGWAIKAALRARVTELEALLGGTPAGATAGDGAALPAPRPHKPAGWYADPIGKHAWRYWEGSIWTTHVADDEGAPTGSA